MNRRQVTDYNPQELLFVRNFMIHKTLRNTC